MSSVDRRLLAQRLEALNVLIRSHAGEIELVDLTEDGCVSLRYTGMCAGCDYRPLTTAGTVEPALLALPGVTAVRVQGPRISAEAEARILATLEGTGSALRSIRVVQTMENEFSN